ncbi:MAG: DNA sulfur modification protein DndB [Prochlorotrichaceae cyanobacterium]
MPSEIHVPLYIGKAAPGYLSERFNDYLKERKNPKGRTKLVIALNKYKSKIVFWWATLPQIYVDTIEEHLLGCYYIHPVILPFRIEKGFGEKHFRLNLLIKITKVNSMADYVPALRARMGDWQYYVTVMKLGKIARECRLAEEIHANKDLDDLIQRAIQDRVRKEMVPYLLNEPQRFYGALVVAVYGGTPEFSPVAVHEHSLLDDTQAHSYGFGLLRFDGGQIYYALDGQHRLKSIQEAISINPDLAQEEISVIILKHETSPEGLERTRRLFSTLNRRAKPTSSSSSSTTNDELSED